MSVRSVKTSNSNISNCSGITNACNNLPPDQLALVMNILQQSGQKIQSGSVRSGSSRSGSSRSGSLKSFNQQAGSTLSRISEEDERSQVSSRSHASRASQSSHVSRGSHVSRESHGSQGSQGSLRTRVSCSSSSSRPRASRHLAFTPPSSPPSEQPPKQTEEFDQEFSYLEFMAAAKARAPYKSFAEQKIDAGIMSILKNNPEMLDKPLHPDIRRPPGDMSFKEMVRQRFAEDEARARGDLGVFNQNQQISYHGTFRNLSLETSPTRSKLRIEH